MVVQNVHLNHLDYLLLIFICLLRRLGTAVNLHLLFWIQLFEREFTFACCEVVIVTQPYLAITLRLELGFDLVDSGKDDKIFFWLFVEFLAELGYMQDEGSK